MLANDTVEPPVSDHPICKDFVVAYKNQTTKPCRGGGGGSTPLHKASWHQVGFLRRFGPKTGVHFAPFDLESGWVFEGTTGVYEHFYRSNSK